MLLCACAVIRDLLGFTMWCAFLICLVVAYKLKIGPPPSIKDLRIGALLIKIGVGL